MTTTAVGMRCPECARQRTKVVRMREMATVPQVTYALIAINVVAFLVEGRFGLGGGTGDSVYLKGALLGSGVGRELVGEGVAFGQWWRIVTGGFLHAGLLHIFFNMYLLYILGQMLEPVLGSVRFALVYFVSLLTGSLVALLVSPHDLTVGASGAVFGLMGAAAVEMRARQIPVMQSGIGFLIVINLALSFAIPGISWGGHVGGLIGGALTMLALQLGDRRRAQTLAFAGCVVLAAAAFAGSIAISKSTLVEPISVPSFVSPESTPEPSPAPPGQ
ncbi:MAG TPA: rhomboid family intramembrane serine protease [Solirubrobacteraceae bacterium]|jgi:membrane associated rhomboid family serine protease|nr:rhomboid family intramembrane serine protease [Solirubrobacteraceae bacterium]